MDKRELKVLHSVRYHGIWIPVSGLGAAAHRLFKAGLLLATPVLGKTGYKLTKSGREALAAARKDTTP